jgi:hypothetical protein
VTPLHRFDEITTNKDLLPLLGNKQANETALGEE